MDRHIAPPARRQLRAAIAEADGNEVFFRGRCDEHQCVVAVEVLARGSATAVPAIVQTCAYGDVVLHNHPSGELQPSTADLEIAGRLGSLGIGFFIVDNRVKHLYRVVEAFAPTTEHDVEPQQIAAILGPQGAVAAALPGYEERPEQLRMAFAVGEAFNRGQLAVIEAGTGTGKSLAYLVPAILWAVANEERVVVSTNTINLQEQLLRKDLPFLQRAARLEFRAELVKGRGNYVCRRRLDTAVREPGLFDGELSGEFSAIQAWATQTADGSREDLSFIPAGQVWDEVCCEADQCPRTKCPHYRDCFLHQARRRAAQADVLVVNHALLLADLALRQQTDNYSATAVLPPFDQIILDEAHHLEDVATNYFGSQTTRFVFARTLNRLRHPRKPERGLLPRLLAQLGKELPDSEDALYRDLHGQIETLLRERQALLERAVHDLERVGEEVAATSGRAVSDKEGLKIRLVPAFTTQPAWGAIARRLRELAAATATLARGLRRLLKECGRLPEEIAERLAPIRTDLRGIAGRLEGLGADLVAFVAADETVCAWIEVEEQRLGRGTGMVTRLCAAPLEVAGQLKDALYDRFHTVVLCSATLAVENSFAYYKQRVGLERSEAGRVTELLLTSPFDFARQTLVAVPTDVPEPNRPGYGEMVRDLSEAAILAADGRSFVLFTAYSLLRRVHGELAPVLEARGYSCLLQGRDNRHRLLQRFAADATSVLFATDSFWEGVDVPGRSLEQVIITRLPFKVPTEPVLEARAEAITLRGGDPFMEYTVPQAVIKFKQGFGRLIRHRDDRGVVLILDRRVVSKGYGRLFLRSLPPVRVVAATTTEVLAAMTDFFRPVSGAEGGEGRAPRAKKTPPNAVRGAEEV